MGRSCLFAFHCGMCSSSWRDSALLCPAHLCLSCLECDAWPLCFTFGAFVWLAGEVVQQAHLAETKGVTAVWSVGFQVPGPAEVQARKSCSSQLGLPCSAMELHPSAWQREELHAAGTRLLFEVKCRLETKPSPVGSNL